MLLTAFQSLESQGFDASKDSSLTGAYWVRQIACSGVTAAGTNGRAQSVSGTITFDGAGNFSFAGQSMDTQNGSGTPGSYAVTGTYRVSANNLVQITDPLDPQLTMSGELGVSALVASSPTGGSADLLVAIPEGSSVSPTTLQGTYWIGLLDFLHGKNLLVRNALFSLTATGAGTFNNFLISGNAANLGIAEISQVVSGATYSVSANGSGTATFPLPAGLPAESSLISGNKILYISGDGNLLVGGAADGYDLLVGLKELPPPASNSNLKDLFYLAGMGVDFSPLRSGGAISWTANSGSFNASGTGTSLWHEHLHAPDAATIDYTFDSEYQITANGTVSEPYFQYAVGAGGQAFILTGNADNYALTLGVKPPALSGTGVFLNPAYVSNAASFSPITDPIAPGELVSLYGSGLASTTSAATSAPYQDTIAGVGVSMNGIPAPLYQVSPTRIDVVVPQGVLSSSSYVTIQVNNNGQKSNPVMVYGSSTAPGIFTLGENGVGDGAILHADYSVVSPTNPAHPGEIVQVFLTGLGEVQPAVTDGAAGAIDPLSLTVAPVSVYINGRASTVSYSGLAPLYPGLYQVNVQVPAQGVSGDVYLDISTPSAYHSQARIFVGP